MKKGKFKWIIVNRHGNFWDGKAFVMSRDKAKLYKCHGKALVAMTGAKATLTSKIDKVLVELKPVAIAKQFNSFQEWVAENP